LNLVTPTSVAVIVNPSQIDLLRAQAERLRAQYQDLKKQLNSENAAANQTLLYKNLKEAMDDLDKTEATYKEKGGSKEKEGTQSSAEAVNVFFDDIRFDYSEALKSLRKDSALFRQAEPRLVLVSSALGGSALHLNPASEAVLRSILHNANAYDVMVSSGKSIFDLEVSSEPKGATVSYRQRIDREYTTLDHKTDWRIPNLYHATYLIRFQKQGCEEQVITFQGGESNSTSVNAPLVCKSGAR
jgi:hypothetical protein